MFYHRHSWTLLCGLLIVVIAGVSTYGVKAKITQKEAQLESLHVQILAQKDRLRVLEADWSYLTNPDRIQRLAEERLALNPISPERILTTDQINNSQTVGLTLITTEAE